MPRRETITWPLAGLNLVGRAASLAAQDSLNNFLGTLPRPGEQVAVQGVGGTIEGVGFRSTLLRTVEDSLRMSPNSAMAAPPIDDGAPRTSRRLPAIVSLE